MIYLVTWLYYKEYVADPTEVVKFFINLERIKVFVTNCLCDEKNPDHVEIKAMLENRRTNPIKTMPHLKRWKTVSASSKEAVEIEWLSVHWDSDAMLGEQARTDRQEHDIALSVVAVDNAEDPEQSQRDHIAKVDTVIRKTHFWAYRRMVNFMDSGIDEVTKLAETCPCHPTKEAREELGNRRCPRAGVWAPFLAAGGTKQILRVYFAIANSRILLVCRDLTKEYRDIVIGDWLKGREYIELTFTSKLDAPWTTIPLLFAIGWHWDATTAKDGLYQALVQFDQMLKDNPDHKHHKVSLQLCAKGCTNRCQMASLLKGRPMEQLPLLEMSLARLGLMSVSEYLGGALHATGKGGNSFGSESFTCLLQLRFAWIRAGLQDG